MRIAEFDEYLIQLLLPWHRAAVAAMLPGDLSAALGEWICKPGQEGALIAGSLHDLAEEIGFRAGIWSGQASCGVVGINDIADGSAGISYALDARFRGLGIMTRACRAIIS